jgi:hypothetical protein
VSILNQGEKNELSSDIQTDLGSSGLMDILWTSDGDWWPNNNVNRYRLNEVPSNENFYQWWYWMVKDLDTHDAFAVCYYIIRTPENPEITGAYIMFSVITSLGKIMVWYKYSLEELNYLGNYFQMTLGQNAEFTQIPLSDDIYHVSGNMNNPSHIWTSSIIYPGIDENSVFSWNWDITRIVGCNTQNDIIDSPLMDQGIKWNTFCFDGRVLGQVQIGNTSYVFNQFTNARAYGDMNFDEIFLGKAEPCEPEDKYRWSWASATKYNLNNPSLDTSIIAGYGISNNMFGISVTPTGIFAAAYNVLNHNVVWKSIDTREGLIDVNLIEKCSWGSSADSMIEVNIDAWDYFTYTDQYGNARIPHYQKYTLDGEFIKIEMTIYVTSNIINRLPSPYSEYIWSNFEALGATAFVKIFSKTYRWWDIFHINPVITLADQFYDYNAGLEYGYAADISL